MQPTNREAASFSPTVTRKSGSRRKAGAPIGLATLRVSPRCRSSCQRELLRQRRLRPSHLDGDTRRSSERSRSGRSSPKPPGSRPGRQGEPSRRRPPRQEHFSGEHQGRGQGTDPLRVVRVHPPFTRLDRTTSSVENHAGSHVSREARIGGRITSVDVSEAQVKTLETFETSRLSAGVPLLAAGRPPPPPHQET